MEILGRRGVDFRVQSCCDIRSVIRAVMFARVR